MDTIHPNDIQELDADTFSFITIGFIKFDSEENAVLLMEDFSVRFELITAL